MDAFFSFVQTEAFSDGIFTTFDFRNCDSNFIDSLVIWSAVNVLICLVNCATYTRCFGCFPFCTLYASQYCCEFLFGWPLSRPRPVVHKCTFANSNLFDGSFWFHRVVWCFVYDFRNADNFVCRKKYRTNAFFLRSIFLRIRVIRPPRAHNVVENYTYRL